MPAYETEVDMMQAETGENSSPSGANNSSNEQPEMNRDAGDNQSPPLPPGCHTWRQPGDFPGFQPPPPGGCPPWFTRRRWGSNPWEFGAQGMMGGSRRGGHHGQPWEYGPHCMFYPMMTGGYWGGMHHPGWGRRSGRHHQGHPAMGAWAGYGPYGYMMEHDYMMDTHHDMMKCMMKKMKKAWKRKAEKDMENDESKPEEEKGDQEDADVMEDNEKMAENANEETPAAEKGVKDQTSENVNNDPMAFDWPMRMKMMRMNMAKKCEGKKCGGRGKAMQHMMRRRMMMRGLGHPGHWAPPFMYPYGAMTGQGFPHHESPHHPPHHGPGHHGPHHHGPPHHGPGHHGPPHHGPHHHGPHHHGPHARKPDGGLARVPVEFRQAIRRMCREQNVTVREFVKKMKEMRKNKNIEEENKKTDESKNQETETDEIEGETSAEEPDAFTDWKQLKLILKGLAEEKTEEQKKGRCGKGRGRGCRGGMRRAWRQYMRELHGGSDSDGQTESNEEGAACTDAKEERRGGGGGWQREHRGFWMRRAYNQYLKDMYGEDTDPQSAMDAETRLVTGTTQKQAVDDSPSEAEDDATPGEESTPQLDPAQYFIPFSYFGGELPGMIPMSMMMADWMDSDDTDDAKEGVEEGIEFVDLIEDQEEPGATGGVRVKFAVPTKGNKDGGENQADKEHKKKGKKK